MSLNRVCRWNQRGRADQVALNAPYNPQNPACHASHPVLDFRAPGTSHVIWCWLTARFPALPAHTTLSSHI